MAQIKSFHSSLVKTSELEFESHVLDLFRYQSANTEVYRQYLFHLGVEPKEVTRIDEIPFLPIEFFKEFEIKAGDWPSEKVFTSSGTTASVPSQHCIRSESAYHQHAKKMFEAQVGPIDQSIVVALLPSYLERSGSSLVSMVQYFISSSGNQLSGFYLYNHDELIELLINQSGSVPVYLFGVTFALLDLAENYSADLSHVTLIETGGMKGRRNELTRAELYAILKERFSFGSIYSEYGMTELLSQAYGPMGHFPQSLSLTVLVRDINDPFSYVEVGRTGGINVIDLANRDTCSFIETKDLGKINPDGSFEVLGRFDNSEIRGCNLMVV